MVTSELARYTGQHLITAQTVLSHEPPLGIRGTH